MRVYLVKSSLLIIMLGGTVTGLFVYNQILSLLGRILDFGDYWVYIYIPVVFTLSLLIARVGLKTLVKDLTTTNVFSDISPMMVLKFFIGGFIGCYVGVSIAGTILFILYLVFSNFFV